MSAFQSLLIVDDETALLKQLQWSFKDEFTVIAAQTAEEAINAVRTRNPELMLLDLSLTGDPDILEGFRVLESALLINPLLKVVVMTGHDEKENALKAIEKGAYDFYSKPIVVNELKIILRRAGYVLSLEREIENLRRKKFERYEFEGIIAMSQPMLDVFDTVKKVAPTDISVLITGESGTGKELIARAIHQRSPRSEKAFVPINCGAIPENLLESELFGHEKGSFTGAHTTRAGKFEAADGGTIFLDEIGELSPALQVKLLRFLQDQLIEHIGGRESIKVNTRIITATNRDLGLMLEKRSFREDLYYRINTITIELPPLRERGDDILLLGMRFLHHYNREFSKHVRGFSNAAQKTLYGYEWPGNVRELENRVKRGVIMATGTVIQPEDMDLPHQETPAVHGPAGTDKTAQGEAPGETKTLRAAREEIEKRLITAALLRSSGNVSAAAQELDVSRPTLHDLMKKHGIDPEKFRSAKDKT